MWALPQYTTSYPQFGLLIHKTCAQPCVSARAVCFRFANITRPETAHNYSPHFNQICPNLRGHYVPGARAIPGDDVDRFGIGNVRHGITRIEHGLGASRSPRGIIDACARPRGGCRKEGVKSQLCHIVAKLAGQCSARNNTRVTMFRRRFLISSMSVLLSTTLARRLGFRGIRSRHGWLLKRDDI